MFLADPQGWKKPPVAPAGRGAARRAISRSSCTRPTWSTWRRSTTASASRPASSSPSTPKAAAAGRARSGWSCTAGTSPQGDDAATGVDNWRKFLARQEDEGGFAVPILIENTAGGDNAMARRFDALARLWDAVGEFGVGLLPRHLPRVRRRARTWSTWSSGPRRSPAGSTSCTSTTPATSSAPARDRHANIGDGTIDPEQLAAVCAAAGAPVVVETPAEGQAADIAFLRERLGSAVAAGKGSPPGPAVTRSDVRRTGRARGAPSTPDDGGDRDGADRHAPSPRRRMRRRRRPADGRPGRGAGRVDPRRCRPGRRRGDRAAHRRACCWWPTRARPAASARRSTTRAAARPITTSASTATSATPTSSTSGSTATSTSTSSPTSTAASPRRRTASSPAARSSTRCSPAC